MSKCTSLSLLCMAPLFLFAQEWVDLKERYDVPFTEVKAAFDAHWGDAPYERGKGYKQYKRWEDFMEPRTYPHGERISGRVLLEALKQKAQVAQSSSKSDNTWESVGPTEWQSSAWNPGLGRVNAVAVDPQDENRVFVGTPAGGIWRSTDGGLTWEPLGDDFTAIGVSGIAIHPTNPDRIYIATGDGNSSDTYSIGVLKSEDGGDSWQVTGLVHEVQENIRCRKIIIDPEDHNKLFVATTHGLFVSHNGGDYWEQVISDNVRDVEICPDDSEIVYASSTRVYRSTNGGSNFSQVSDGTPPQNEVNRIEMSVSPSEPWVVYLVAGSQANSGFYGFYRSEDYGQSFELMSNTPNILTWSETGSGEGGQSWYDLAIATSPTDASITLVGGINVWRTNNGGSSWNIRSHWVWPSSIGYTHADIHTLEYFGNTLWCGSDGGIFKSNDNGNTWIDLSDGLQITQYYRIAVSQQNPNKVLSASQDNGTNIFLPSGTYLHLLGGDGNGADIDYSNDNIMYAAYPGGSFQRSTNGGFNFSGYTQGIDENGAWVTPFQLHPTVPSTTYAAYQNVWRRDNAWEDWYKISNFPFNTTLRSMRVAASNPDYVYTSTFSTLMKTDNGGDTWTQISAPLPNLFISDIEVDPENPERIWVCFSGYEAGEKIYFSPDGGASWTNQSGNLPNIPVNCLAYQVGTNDGIYAGTDVGLYFKDADQINWSDFNEGLPNVIINQLILHYPSGQIFAGTYGRGLWKNQLFDSGSALPIANFTEDKRSFCAGDSVQFQNLSLNIGAEVLWEFEGGEPAFSSDLAPLVHYNEPGAYDVKLTIGNDNGEDMLVKESHIHVIDTIGVGAPIFEGFEELTTLEEGAWYPQSNPGETGWQITNEAAFEGNSSVFIENFTGPSGRDYFLRSRSYDLSELDTAVVSMRVAYAPSTSQQTERLRISISNDCGESWTPKTMITSQTTLPTAPPSGEYFVPQHNQWQFIMLTNILPEERTSDFRLQIHFGSAGGNNIYVDNINIGSDLSVDTETSKDLIPGLRMYPNPANDFTQLEWEAQGSDPIELRIFDSTGRLIIQEQHGSQGSGVQNVRINTQQLSQGVYICQVKAANGLQSLPLIIQ